MHAAMTTMIADFDRYLKRIECEFDDKAAMRWMYKYWWLSFVFSAIYLFLIFAGRQYMKNRKPFELRTALCMWSTGLAMFSIIAIYRIYPMFSNIYVQGGFEFTVCDMQYTIGSQGRGLWAFLFPLSKLPELVDTAFIVLRKSKISFLHCYHHISVFIYCWFSYAYPISTGIWFGTVNYFVHAVMYTYYAIKASGRSPPRWVARCVTILQLSQMFFGIFLNYTAMRAFFLGKTCGMNSFTVSISVFFYVTYAILFANFYYWTYIFNKRAAAAAATRKTPQESTESAPPKNDVKGSTDVKQSKGLNGVVSNGIIRHR